MSEARTRPDADWERADPGCGNNDALHAAEMGIACVWTGEDAGVCMDVTVQHRGFDRQHGRNIVGVISACGVCVQGWRIEGIAWKFK